MHPSDTNTNRPCCKRPFCIIGNFRLKTLSRMLFMPSVVDRAMVAWWPNLDLLACKNPQNCRCSGQLSDLGFRGCSTFSAWGYVESLDLASGFEGQWRLVSIGFIASWLWGSRVILIVLSSSNENCANFWDAHRYCSCAWWESRCFGLAW